MAHSISINPSDDQFNARNHEPEVVPSSSSSTSTSTSTIDASSAESSTLDVASAESSLDASSAEFSLNTSSTESSSPSSSISTLDASSMESSFSSSYTFTLDATSIESSSSSTLDTSSTELNLDEVGSGTDVGSADPGEVINVTSDEELDHIYDNEFEVTSGSDYEEIEPRGFPEDIIMECMESDIYIARHPTSPETAETCSICLEEFKNNDVLGKSISCTHKHHFDCMKKWLKRNNVCPICMKTAIHYGS